MIENKYYYLMLITTILSHFIFYIPSYMNTYILDGAITAIFIALFVALISEYIGIYIFNYFKKYTLVEINREILGEKLGGVISFISMILNFSTGIFMCVALVGIANKFILPTTSLLLLEIMIIIPILLNLLNTNKTFLYLLAYLSIFIVFGMLLYYALTFKEIKFDYVKGILVRSFRLPKLTLIIIASYFYTGARNLQSLNPVFKRISYKKTALITTFIAFPAGLLIILIPAGLWGVEAVKTIEHPWISATDTIQVDLFFIERALYLLLPLFSTLGSIQAMTYFFVGNGLLDRMNYKPIIKKTVLFLVLIVLFMMKYILEDTRQIIALGIANMVIHNVFNMILIIVLFILIKRREKKKA